ncbi:hypothetical protein BCR32DRAFT_326802 [Anaeromyces robustus]|uniref:DUF4614 domain-containing protein n=1 Tax=Anaeromyces robustus TaxID=1754192 RepID=A0A1Y1XA08_9FUNG|nr:hypothetical protein BCR32DRAFT_326802 [Anaeromyces robustus]|eukprot:ORX82557.1 hypothetical protein BCR32DRAFT_326802 [Anaeromyces robustus]
MMKRQLDQIENFISISKEQTEEINKLGWSNLKQYTTLEETKRYIEEHRKPTLSYEEALRQVQLESNF